MNKIKKFFGNVKDKVDTYFIKLQLAIMSGLMLAPIPAHASENKVKINTNLDVEATMGNLLTFLFTIMRFAGAAVTVFGAFAFFSSIHNDQPEQKKQGIMTIIAGICMVALPSVLKIIGILA